jgi:MFS family permease
MEPGFLRLPTFGLPRAIVPVFIAMLCVEGALGSYGSIWPLWMERLHADVATVGILLGVPGFLRMLVVGPSAALADRFGPRRLMIGSRIAATSAYLVAFFATDWKQLLPAIVLIAAAEIVFPVAQSYVGHHAPPDQRMRSLTLVFNVGPAVALAISPLASSGIVGAFGIRWAFLLAATFSTVALVSLVRVAPDAPVGSVDTSQPKSSFRDALSQPTVRLLLILQGSMIFTLSLGLALVPTFLEDVRNLSASTIALLGAFPAVGSIVFGLLIARAAAVQSHPLWGVVWATAQTAVGLMIFHQFGNPLVIGLGFFLRGGFFSGWVLFISAIGVVSDPAHRSRCFAASELVGGVAAASGPIVAGVLYSQRDLLPMEIAIVMAALLVPVLLTAQRRLGKLQHGELVTA